MDDVSGYYYYLIVKTATFIIFDALLQKKKIIIRPNIHIVALFNSTLKDVGKSLKTHIVALYMFLLVRYIHKYIFRQILLTVKPPYSVKATTNTTTDQIGNIIVANRSLQSLTARSCQLCVKRNRQGICDGVKK